MSVVLPEKTYFKIGEAAQLVGVKPYIIRYWETEFRTLKPAKTKSRQRLFRHRDIYLLLVIKRLLYEQKYTIEGARRRLKELSAAGVAVEQMLEAIDQPPVVEGADTADEPSEDTERARLAAEVERLRGELAGRANAAAPASELEALVQASEARARELDGELERARRELRREEQAHRQVQASLEHTAQQLKQVKDEMRRRWAAVAAGVDLDAGS